MRIFEIFSQKHTFHFHGFIRFFHLRHNHLGAPLMDYAQRLPRPWQIAPLKRCCSSRGGDWLRLRLLFS